MYFAIQTTILKGSPIITFLIFCQKIEERSQLQTFAYNIESKVLYLTLTHSQREVAQIKEHTKT